MPNPPPQSFSPPVPRDFRFFPLLLAAFILLSPERSCAANGLDLGQCLVTGRAGQAGRSATHTDSIEAEIISGKWRRPAESSHGEVDIANSVRWQSVTTNKDGWFADAALRGGYAYVSVTAESNCTMLLEARGNNLTYVNGQPRTGDPYEYASGIP
jgi:hypothetical protein